MISNRLRLRAALSFATLIALAMAQPAGAQGTAEQRAACAPDAIRLCSDTIPDVPRTTACMSAHRAELSPRCEAAFAAARPAAKPRAAHAETPAPRARVAVARPLKRGPVAAAVQPRASRYPAPRHAQAHSIHIARGDSDARKARRVFHGLCGAGVLDAGTCGFAQRLITLSE